MPDSTQPRFSYDHMFAAMCIMEEIADPQMSDAGTPWQEFRDTHGINHIRNEVIETLAVACDAAWQRAYARHEEAFKQWESATEHGKYESGAVPGDPPNDPGSFDYEFVPFWLRECVDWSDLTVGPRVRGMTDAAG